MASRRSASDLGGDPAGTPSGGSWLSARTPARAGRRSSCLPPTGCPTKRPSPARWCSYAYCRSLHITSFRSREPYPNVSVNARASFSPSPARFPCGVYGIQRSGCYCNRAATLRSSDQVDTSSGTAGCQGSGPPRAASAGYQKARALYVDSLMTRAALSAGSGRRPASPGRPARDPRIRRRSAPRPVPARTPRAPPVPCQGSGRRRPRRQAGS